MDLHNIHDLPDWDNKWLRYINEEDGEEWKASATLPFSKALYKKWQEIFFLMKGVLSALEESEERNDSFFVRVIETWESNGLLIAAKIRISETIDSYALKMENAMEIRMAATEIISDIFVLAHKPVPDAKHLGVVLTEIEEFRLSFKEWVKAFEKDEVDDDWGMF
jgi:hypothetical protein